MRRHITIPALSVLLLFLGSCITIEDEPFVTLSPSVLFQGFLSNNNVNVTATISANPTFLNPGNIPTTFVYEGSIEIFNSESGTMLNSQEVTGGGLTAIVETSTSAENFEDMIIVASGSISAYADKESDGDLENDLFINKANFYQVVSMAEVVSTEDYPVVTMSPLVDFQPHIRGRDLYTTAVVNANPDYLNTGSFPILFDYDGVIQVYDETSGALLKSSSIAGDGLSNAVTVVTDTTGFSGFIIISSGTITCTGDLEGDGPSSDDLFISSAEFYGLLDVDLEN